MEGRSAGVPMASAEGAPSTVCVHTLEFFYHFTCTCWCYFWRRAWNDSSLEEGEKINWGGLHGTPIGLRPKRACITHSIKVS